MHKGTKTLIFVDMSCGLTKLKLKCLAITTMITFGGKREKLVSLRTPSQMQMMAASCCGGCFATGRTGALHKIDSIIKKELKQHLKTSAKKLKAWAQMGLPNAQ